MPPTPPNSQNFSLQDRKWRQDHRLRKHMQFLRCLSGLSRGYESSLCPDGDVVWDSIVQLLDSVVEVFRQAHVGQPLHHPEQLHHATKVVAQTLSRGRTQHESSVQHFSKVDDLLKEMINLLLTNQQLSSVRARGLCTVGKTTCRLDKKWARKLISHTYASFCTCMLKAAVQNSSYVFITLF